jgi:hypothetical protein
VTKLTSDSNVISHWHHPIENFQTSSMEFYAAVELALKPRQIPDISTSRVDWKEGGLLSARREYLRVQRGKLAFDVCAAPFGTGFFFSSWLTDLPPAHGLLYAVLILMAGFVVLGIFVQALGFFGGFFLTIIGYPVLILVAGYFVRKGEFGTEAEDAILAIPLFGTLYERFFKPITYYKMDTAMMFQSAVHSAVLEVIDQLMSAKGVRAMSELERKPIMRGLYQR